MDETPSTALQITATVNPALPPDPKLPEDKLVELARELCQGIKHPTEVFPDYDITQEQFDAHVLTNGYFKRAYDALLIEWNSAGSTNKRLGLKAAAILEDSMPKVGARLTDGKENLTAVVEAGKFFAKLAGAGEDARNAAAGEKFTININIGEQTLKVEAQRTAIPAEVQSFSEGPRPEIEIQSLPKG